MVETKVQLSTFEDIIGFIKQFMNWGASHLAKKHSELQKMEDFYRKEGGTRKSLAKNRNKRKFIGRK